MKKYNVFELWVVKVDDYYFICEKLLDEKTYREIFTKEKIKVLNIENIEPLKNYYSLLAIMNYTTGESLKLTKKELLEKYAEIHAYHVEIKKQYNSNYETLIKEQEEYQQALKEVEKKNFKAKEEVIGNIFDGKGELTESYNMSLSDKIGNCVPIEHGRVLTRKNVQK